MWQGTPQCFTESRKGVVGSRSQSAWCTWQIASTLLAPQLYSQGSVAHVGIWTPEFVLSLVPGTAPAAQQPGSPLPLNQPAPGSLVPAPISAMICCEKERLKAVL